MSQIDNKRIAKNTMMLYFRTIFSMFISLFTSRVTLQVLGVEDYGTQAAVGGIIAMLTIVTNSMTNSIDDTVNDILRLAYSLLPDIRFPCLRCHLMAWMYAENQDGQLLDEARLLLPNLGDDDEQPFLWKAISAD